MTASWRRALITVPIYAFARAYQWSAERFPALNLRSFALRNAFNLACLLLTMAAITALMRPRAPQRKDP